MKFTRIALAAAACCGFVATGAQAQGLRQPGSVQPVALTYDYYAQDNAAPSPSDLAAADSSDLTFVGDVSQKDGKGCGCDAKGGGKGGKGGKGCSTCEPWRLFPTFGDGWTIEGYIAGGGTYNASNPVSNYNGPVTFNDRANEMMLNQLYLSIGRDADNGGCGWAWGARADVLYGQDYVFTQAVGLETNTDGTPSFNSSTSTFGLALPQIYGEVAYNDLSVKVGHFYTIMGYEGVKPTSNFFYSHAYTMQYGEPFTHTGALATYDYNCNWDFYAGLVNGWNTWDAVSDKLQFLGGATYTPDSERYSLTGTFISGEENGSLAPLPTTRRTGYSIVFDYDISCRLKYVFQHDNFWQSNDALNAGNDSEWYGINQYLFYTVNDCWKLGARFEWFRDDDGVRLQGAPVRELVSGTAPVATPTFLNPAMSAGDYFNLTVGANWSPSSNLTIRPELRWDWSGNTVGQPYNSGTKDSQFLAAFDAIVLF
ncbi:MAG: porin [Planctomycetales bacterium]|nr:porin [Planctomycetales bacterium]